MKYNRKQLVNEEVEYFCGCNKTPCKCVFKKCGHVKGYKCCCRSNYTAEHSFDLVDEMNLARRRLG